MDRARCIWCKLERSEWQCHGHDRGAKWTLQELKRVASSLNNSKTENGVKSCPQLDCVESERFIFPVLHVTLGFGNRLLKHAIDCADKLVERTPQLLEDVRMNQIEAERKRGSMRQANKRQRIGDFTMAQLLLTCIWHRVIWMRRLQLKGC
jgi:hypothetical protein